MVFTTPARCAPLLTSAFCAVLLVFPATTQAQLPGKSPHGLFQLGGNAWTNPIVDGMRLQIKWTDVQPASASRFDWSSIDKEVAHAQTYHKQLGISLVLLSDPPDWLTAIPGVKTYELSLENGQTVSMVLPWDPIVQRKIIAFVTQLCLRYDGLVDYIVMGGLGYNTETYMPDPADIGLAMTLSHAVAAWTNSSNKIIDAYGTHLFSTPFIIAAGIPFSSPNASPALTGVVSRAATMYGDRFGVMDMELSARGTTGSLPAALVAQYSSTNPAGAQLLCPVAGNDDGQTLGGTLKQALAAGIALGAQWIEIYDEDAQNARYSATLEKAKTELASIPTPPAAPSATKAPHGLYEIGGDAWTNPGISGWRAEILWSKSNTADGVYNWKKIDDLYTNAVKYHKQLGLTVRILSSVPTWVTSLQGVKTYKSSLGPDPMVLPFDTIVQPKIIAFIKALCLHFDGELDFITMGGLGYKVETYMPLPSDIGLTTNISDYTTAWVNSSDLFIDTYNQNLKTTPFVIAAGVPFNDPGASTAITTVINHGLTYPLFGVMQWGLKATSTNGFFLNKIIQDNDAGRATGFQLAGASDGSVGGDLQGTLEQALTAGNSLGADWIEIYSADAMNPVYTVLLATFNSLLK